MYTILEMFLAYRLEHDGCTRFVKKICAVRMLLER